MPEAEIKFYVAQIALAIGHLHQNHIVYRDLKLENIMIAEDGYIKIINYALSK